MTENKPNEFINKIDNKNNFKYVEHNNIIEKKLNLLIDILDIHKRDIQHLYFVVFILHIIALILFYNFN